jgi:lipopolysaccharide transport system permease protein
MGIVKEIFVKRYLIKELIVKDLKVRYSRPVLGFLWAFLSPLLMVAIFYLVFSFILQVRTKEAPFFLYLMSGVFSWRFFQDSLMCSVTSMVDNKNLIREANFAHYLVPLSIVLANGINCLPSLVILIMTALFILKGLPLFILLLPVILAIHLVIATAMSILFSILYVRWRDTKYVLEALLMITFYLTPVFYSLYLVKDTFSKIWFSAYIYNPFVGVLSLYRITILNGFYPAIKEDTNILSLAVIPAAFALVILSLAFFVYKKNKNIINDYLAY